MTQSNQGGGGGGLIDDSRWAFNMAQPLLNGLAMTTKIFLRTGMGSQRPGLAGLFGLLILLFIGAGTRYSDPRWVLNYLIAFLAASLLQRITCWVRHWRGRREHSCYDGYPLLCRLVPRRVGGPLDEMLVKRVAEPLLVIALGVWSIDHLHYALGNLWFWSGIALFVTANLSHLRETTELRNMRDALLVQRERARQFRSLIDRDDAV